MSSSKLKKGPEEGVVLFEDQQRINLFAKKNSLLNDLKEQVSIKEKDLQNIQDASDDLMLMDDEELVPYEMGEVFVLLYGEDVQQRLEEHKTKTEEELLSLKTKCEEIRQILKKVKSQLYAKFGDNINLEAPDSEL